MLGSWGDWAGPRRAWKVSLRRCNLVWLLSGRGQCKGGLCVAGPLQGAKKNPHTLSVVLNPARNWSSPWY